jgi:hypothetical protein
MYGNLLRHIKFMIENSIYSSTYHNFVQSYKNIRYIACWEISWCWTKKCSYKKHFILNTCPGSYSKNIIWGRNYFHSDKLVHSSHNNYLKMLNYSPNAMKQHHYWLIDSKNTNNYHLILKIFLQQKTHFHLHLL